MYPFSNFLSHVFPQYLSQNPPLLAIIGLKDGTECVRYRFRCFPMDMNRILTMMTDNIVDLSMGDGAILLLYDEASHEAYVRAISGSLRPEFGNLRLTPSGGSTISSILSSGNTWSTSDYLNDPSISHDQEMDSLFRENGMKSCLSVPLRMGKDVIGILMVLSQEETGFSHQEAELLQQYANRTVSVLENARFASQIQEFAITEERSRLSREMHDNLGQTLGSLGLEIDEIGLLLTSGQEKQAIQKLKEVREVVKHASDEARHLIVALRTSASHDVDLIPLLREYLGSFERQTNTEITLNVQSEKATRFSPRVSLQLVRVIQEALTNARKHAHASRVEVCFDIIEGEAVIGVTDDGIGFEVASVHPRGQHFGIQVMSERISELGGSLEINSHPGRGTQVLAKIPLEVRHEI